MLDAALELEVEPIDRVVRARALYTRALADLLRGRVLDCLLSFQRALDEARAAGSRADEGLALTKIGLMLDQADRPDEARERFDQARAIATDLDEPALHADWMLTTAGAFLWRGRTANAAWHAAQAAEGFRVAGDRRGQSMACAQVAVTYLSLGRFEEAELAANEALSLLEVTADHRTEGYVLSVLGRLHQVRGQLDDARATLTAALAIHRAVGDRWSEGVLHGFLGNVAFEAGLLDAARLAYGEAVARLQGTGERHYSAIFLAALGAVELAQGRVDAATSRFRSGHRAARRRARPLDPRHRGSLLRARGRRARAPRRGGRRRRSSGASPPRSGGEDRSRPGPRGRRRAGPRALRRRRPLRRAPPRARDRRARAHRRAHRGAARGLAPDADRRPRGPLVSPAGAPARARAQGAGGRLVLARLVRQHVDAPGRALSLGDLFAAGWPGERIAAKAAANRVYVTLTKLRQLGLGGLLQSRDDGFLLDPAAIVLEAPDHEQPVGRDKL